jgi:hypothetical protein
MAAATDDKLMNDAVNTLIADTDAASKPTTTPADDATPTATNDQADDSTDDTADKPGTAEDDDEDTSNGHVKIANKKVIMPIDNGPEKDLDALLAEEEAKEAAETSGHPAPVTDRDLAKAEAALAEAASGKDANSTADEEAAVDAKIEDFVAGATTEANTPAPMTAASEVTPNPQQTPAPARKMASSPTEEKPADTTTPTVKPIVITEDAPAGAPPASLSGNPGAPAAAPAANTKSPADPNSIAL